LEQLDDVVHSVQGNKHFWQELLVRST